MTRLGCGTTMWWVVVAVLWWTHGGKQVWTTIVTVELQYYVEVSNVWE